MSRILKLLVVLLSLCSMTAQAASSVQSRNEKLRPKGPVTVTADRAEFDKSGVMIYSGNVLMVSDTLQLKGDRLELRQFPGDHYEAKLQGSLAHMEQSGDVDDKGQPLPPMLADGVDMIYDTRTGLLDIVGQARAVRGKNEVNGNTIRYNVNERRVQANGGQGGQVKIIIQPPASGQKSSSTPTSAATPGKAPKSAEKKTTEIPQASSPHLILTPSLAPVTAPATSPTAPAQPVEAVPAPATPATAEIPAVAAPAKEEKASAPVGTSP